MKKWLRIIWIGFLGLSGQVNAQSAQQISPAELAKLLESGKHIQLVDVRTPQEYKDGFIKGAVLADWKNKQEFFSVSQRLDKSKPVYTYCLAGVRSAEAANALRKSGFTVIDLTGGIKAWKKEGFKTSDR